MDNADNQLPLITAIIPTYRRPQLLRRAILSVLRQTYQNLVVWVYDNASNDATAEVVKQLSQTDPRVQYYCHSDNLGAIKNFNFGLSRVQTPYFSILSDDDVLIPDFYERAMQKFGEHPQAGFVATQTISATNSEIKDISFKSYEPRLYQPPEGLLKMSHWEIITWTGILFRKAVIEEVGLLDEEMQGPDDSDFLIKIAASFQYVVIKYPGAIFFVHDASLSSTWSELDALPGYIQMLERIRHDLKIPADIRPIVYQNVKKVIANTLWLSGLIEVKKQRFANANQLAQSLGSNFSEPRKSVILYQISRWCESSSVFRRLFVQLIQIKKLLNLGDRARFKALQATYRPYLKYLS